MSQSSVPQRTVPTRRISFEESLRELPKHYAADGDLIQSHIAAGLSAVFPDGEDFFVRSVRHYRDQITDPELKRQVGGFIGQEAMHGRQHRLFNDRLDEARYPAKGSERLRIWTMKFLRFGFILGMTIQVILSMLTDRRTYNPRTVWRSWRKLRRSPIMDRALWLQLKDYERRDFHPDDRDNKGLVEY